MYDQPYTFCKNVNADPGCRERMVLPLFPLPREYDHGGDPTPEEISEYLSRWPPDTWKATIGCPSCGKVLQYEAHEVWTVEAPFYGEGQYHSDTTCYRVEFECANPSCRVPVRFHTFLNDQITTLDALLGKLGNAFFSGKCSAGHDLLPVPRSRYRVERVLGAIPSDA